MRRSLGRLKVSPRVLVLWMSGQAESPVEVFLAAVDQRQAHQAADLGKGYPESISLTKDCSGLTLLAIRVGRFLLQEG